MVMEIKQSVPKTNSSKVKNKTIDYLNSQNQSLSPIEDLYQLLKNKGNNTLSLFSIIRRLQKTSVMST
jgi:hypothetical protein